MPTQLVPTLQAIGLSPKSAQVYLALLELGEGTISQIAAKANLKRPITYVIVADLVQAGYITPLPGHKISRFRAIEPIKMYHHLQSRVHDFQQALPFFNALYSQHGNKPNIQYFQGRDGVRHVYRDMERAPEGCFITSLDHIKKYLPEEVDRWLHGLKSGTLVPKARHLLAQTPTNLAFGRATQNRRQQVRYLPKGQKLDLDFALYQNKFALTSFEQEPFIVVIESAPLVASLQVLFDLAWQGGIVLK